MSTKFKYIQLCGYHDHPNAHINGVILEHRLVMSNHLKRPLKKDEIVHHKDEDPTNNEIENLAIESSVTHATIHSPRHKIIELKCTYCGRVFNRRFNQVVTKLKAGQKKFYCDRKCMAKDYGGGRPKQKKDEILNNISG